MPGDVRPFVREAPAQHPLVAAEVLRQDDHRTAPDRNERLLQAAARQQPHSIAATGGNLGEQFAAARRGRLGRPQDPQQPKEPEEPPANRHRHAGEIHGGNPRPNVQGRALASRPPSRRASAGHRDPGREDFAARQRLAPSVRLRAAKVVPLTSPPSSARLQQAVAGSPAPFPKTAPADSPTAPIR